MVRLVQPQPGSWIAKNRQGTVQNKDRNRNQNPTAWLEFQFLEIETGWNLNQNCPYPNHGHLVQEQA